jgi:hypothetical protein
MASIEEKRALWAQRVADQRASGLPAAVWCREQGINQPSLHYWLKQLPRTDAADALTCVPQWLAVPMDGLADPRERSAGAAVFPGPRNGLTVHIGRISIDIAPGFDPQLLCNVLSVLTRQAVEGLEARC